MTLVVSPSPVTGVVLGASATGWTHTGDTAETKLVSVAIPANTIGLNGTVEIITHWTIPTNGNTKTLFVRFGAANDLTGTTVYNDPRTTNTAMLTRNYFANRATNAQIMFPVNVSGGFGSTGTASPATAAIDTTALTYVVFSCTCGVNTDTIKLESYIVRLIPAV